MQNQTLPEVLLKPEIAKLFRCSLRHVDYMVAAQDIPFIKVGRRGIRFRRDSILKWMEAREKGGEALPPGPPSGEEQINRQRKGMGQ